MPATKTTLRTLEVSGELPVSCLVQLAEIPDCETAKRAIEVALAGDHGIVLVYQKDAPAFELLHAAHRMAETERIGFRGLAIPTCPCGCFGRVDLTCHCSMRRIIALKRKVFERAHDHDIAIEITPPVCPKRRGEASEQVMARVMRAKGFALRTTELSGDCQQLMKYYTERFGTSRVPPVEKIAATIARLDRSPTIQPRFLMEAAQYQMLWHDLRHIFPNGEVAAGA